MKSTLFVALMGPIAVAACVSGNADTDPLQNKDTCSAAPLQHLIGGPAKVVTSLNLRNPLRVIAPDQMVTEDYQPDRINVETDAKGKVLRITCG